MPKALAISGMVISVLLLILFGLDLAVGAPFKGVSKAMDVGFVVCAILLGYMGWSAFRDLV